MYLRLAWSHVEPAEGEFNWSILDTPIFLDKLARFLGAVGARYDGHPRLAFVDVGTLGIWGEGHPLAKQDTLATLRKHIELHKHAFPGTLPPAAPGSDVVEARERRFPLPPLLAPGPYTLFVSVGDAAGATCLALPLDGDNGRHGYPVGQVRVE